MQAAWEGETDVVVELVKGGANLDLQNKVCVVMNTGYPRCSAIFIVVYLFIIRDLLMPKYGSAICFANKSKIDHAIYFDSSKHVSS